MILTGRTGLLALIGVLPIAVSPWPAKAFVILLAMLAAVVTIDVVLAASTRRLRFVRSPNGSARLGQPVDAGLLIHNDGGAGFAVRCAMPGRQCQGEPRTHRVVIASGLSQQVHTQLRPVRRGDQRAAVVTARLIGPLGFAGRQSSQPIPGHVRVLPPFLSRKHLPSRLAKLREIDGLLPTLIRGRAPNSIRCVSMWSAMTSARSTGGPAPGAATSWSAPGGPSGTDAW